MTKRIIQARQGDANWHAHRATHYNASEAAAMLGLDPHKSRNDLLAEKATGIAPEVDAATQARFDRGHEYEAIARPWAEEIIGDELYPVVLSDEVDGLPLGASLDGLPMAEDVAWEHKSLNKELTAALAENVIPERYKPQMEQQLLVSGAKRCLFMASSGDKETMQFGWYESDPEVRARVLAGWKQFHADLAAYVHRPAEAAPEGRAPEKLPALRINVTGMVTESNLEEFQIRAIAVFKSIRTDLSTDEDFANAAATVKWCGEIETRLSAAKQHALSQTESIDALFRAIDAISEEARAKRLELDKLVKARKETVREEIRWEAVSALREHYKAINATFGGRVELGVPAAFGADVGTAMKGRKTIASLRDAADTTLAHAKMDASATADRVRVNLQTLDAEAGEYMHLFPDAAHLVVAKAADDLKALVAMRVAAHKDAEKARLDAERERIRAEEQRKAQADAERKQAEEQAKARAATKSAQPAEPPRTATVRNIVGEKQARPSDTEIINVLALHYRVHEFRVIEWLLDINLEAESDKLAAGQL